MQAIIKLKLITKQIILNLKYIIFSPKNLVILIFISISPYVITLFFIPMLYSFSLLILMSVVMPTGIIYISTSYNIRDSVLYKNMSITKNNKFEFYFASFICMFIIAIFLLLLTIILLSILAKLNLLISDYWWGNDQYKYLIFKIPFIPLVYSVFESVLILFATCYFFQSFISNKKGMYIVVLSMMILTVIFGGAFNDYYLHLQLNQDLTTSVIPMFDAVIFPSSVYYISLLFPLFGPSQHLASIGGSFVFNENTNSFYYNIKNRDYIFFAWLTNSNSKNNDLQNLGWNILWFAPIFWTSIFGFVGTITSKIKK